MVICELKVMQATRQLLRAAGKSVVPGGSGQAIPAPQYFEPASKAPSPNGHILAGIGVGLVFAVTYKVRLLGGMREAARAMLGAARGHLRMVGMLSAAAMRS